MATKEATAQLLIPKVDLPAPEAVNFFHFTFSGPEMEMLVGILDLNHVLDANSRPRNGVVQLRPEVTHRFLMSIRGFALLKQQVEEISKKIEELTGAKVDMSQFQVRVE